MQRLSKYLAHAGVASRRKCEEVILEGRVKVNGKIVDIIGTKVDENNDVILVDNKPIAKNIKLVYIMFNKPEGCITTVSDQFGRKSVMSFFKNMDTRIYPVGRLDYNSSGLIILTNDGDTAYRLTHPKHNIEKVYIAKVKGEVLKEEIKRFENGLFIDNGPKTAPAKIRILKNGDNFTVCEIKIKEGRNRQVRKMCSAIGHSVISLKRTAVGRLYLKDLKKGDFRFLTDDEIKYLKNI